MTGDRYVVTKVGPRCPLKIGEHISIGKRRWFDIFTGIIVSMEVIREDGSVVKLVAGPETGAYLDDQIIDTNVAI